jgi:hypothetical protein
MLRRDFIKTTASVLAVSTLPSASALVEADEPKSRSVFPLNRNWRYPSYNVTVPKPSTSVKIRRFGGSSTPSTST